MVSLLTNESAMVALSTLRSVNKDLSQAQSEISTGKSIASARDNAAIWAVSTVMSSDVESFKSISESLDLGASTVAVARSASEQVTDLLTEIKGLVVAAQEDNVDRSKVQTDIGQLRGQIGSIVNAAQFNGLNLLKGTENVDILSSLDRASDQSVSSSKISVARSDLSTSSGTFSSAGDDLGSVAITGTPDTAVNDTPRTSEITIDLGGDDVAEGGATFGFSINTPTLAEPIDVLTQPATEGATKEDIADALVDSFNTQKAARPTTLGSVTLQKIDLGGGDFSVRLTNSDAFTDLTLTSLTGNTPLGDGTEANDDGALTIASLANVDGAEEQTITLDDGGSANFASGTILGFALEGVDIETGDLDGLTLAQGSAALKTAFDTAQGANAALDAYTLTDNGDGTLTLGRAADATTAIPALAQSSGYNVSDAEDITFAAAGTYTQTPSRDISVALGADDAGEAGSVYGFNLDVDGSGGADALAVQVTLTGDETEEEIVDALIAQAAIVSGANADAFDDFEFSREGSGTSSELRITRVSNLATNFDVTGASTPAEETDVVANRDAQLTVGTGTVAGRASSIELTDRTVNEGDAYRISYQGVNIDYVARSGDTVDDIGDGLKAALEIKKDTNTDLSDVNIRIDKTGTNTVVKIDDGAAGGTLSTQVRDKGTAAGGLVKLGAFDVSTKEGAQEALADIEDLIQTGINAAASFGSAQKRIEIQDEFVTNLVDSLKTGIGALTDADLEETSARLQSLQVQQQLGIQALSIANQQPQALLSLFR